MWLLLVTFLAGLAHGARPEPSARRTRLVATDLLLATALALLSGAGAWLLNVHPLGLNPEETAANHILSALFVGLAFIIGAWIADLALTQRARRLTRHRSRQRGHF